MGVFMTKIYEITESTIDSKLYIDLYDVSCIGRKIVEQTEFVLELPYADYNYLSILANKTKLMLAKITQIMEFNIRKDED